jgi:hypothetical protein
VLAIAAYEKIVGVGEGPLPVVRVRFELLCPSVELLPGGPPPEGANVGERYACLPERIYQPSIGQLAGGVVAIPRARVHCCRCEQSLGRVRSEPFG